MEDDIKSRLRLFIKRLNISERDFCQSIGMSHAYVQNMGNKINSATRLKISTAYPLLSLEWLLTGSGEMLLDTPVSLPAPLEEKKAPKAPDSADMASRILELAENFRADLAKKDKTIEGLVASVRQLTEELAAQRSKLDALAEEGPASGGQASPSVPSRVGSPVSAD